MNLLVSRVIEQRTYVIIKSYTLEGVVLPIYSYTYRGNDAEARGVHRFRRGFQKVFFCLS